jgi:recombination protein RecA
MAREKKAKDKAVTKDDLAQIEARKKSRLHDGPDDLSGLIASVQESLGGAAKIQHLHDVRTPYGIRRPTGVADLDMALKGGFPAGTMNQVFGPDGAGKDLITNHIIAENQRVHGEKANAFWMSFGYKPDLPFMRMAGCQIAVTDDELRAAGIDPALATPEQRGRDVGNLLFVDLGNIAAMENPAEVLLTAVIKLVRSNRFQIGFVNELGSGETKDSVVKGLADDAKVATWAGLVTTFIQKFYTAMRMPGDDMNETTIFMMLPVRANMDSFTSKYVKHSQPSGYALKHAKAVDLHVKSGQVFRDKAGHILRKDINWKIAKGKLGISEGDEGVYQFVPGEGIDLLGGMINTAKAFGIIHRHGAYYQVLDYEDKIKGGIEGVTELLRANAQLAQEVREAVHKQMSMGVVADPSDLEDEDG